MRRSPASSSARRRNWLSFAYGWPTTPGLMKNGRSCRSFARGVSVASKLIHCRTFDGLVEDLEARLATFLDANKSGG